MKPFSEHMRYEYPLNPNSLVLDIGAYHGDWSKEICKRYDCEAHVFEPVPDYYRLAESALGPFPKARLYNLAVGAEDGEIRIGIAENSSGIFNASDNFVMVPQKSLAHVMTQMASGRMVDVIKLNCEGSEFPLLLHAINAGICPMLKNIQVQFHHVFPGADSLYYMIRNELLKTHELTYESLWCWENYKLK